MSTSKQNIMQLMMDDIHRNHPHLDELQATDELLNRLEMEDISPIDNLLRLLVHTIMGINR